MGSKIFCGREEPFFYNLDIYSLGCIGLYMVTGVISEDTAPSLKKVRRSSPEIAAIISKMLAPVDERPSKNEILRMLEAIRMD